MTAFSNQLQFMRRAAGLSQAGLAKQLKANPSYVSRLEADNRRPSRGMVADICNALGDEDGVLMIAAGYFPEWVIRRMDHGVLSPESLALVLGRLGSMSTITIFKELTHIQEAVADAQIRISRTFPVGGDNAEEATQAEAWGADWDQSVTGDDAGTTDDELAERSGPTAYGTAYTWVSGHGGDGRDAPNGDADSHRTTDDGALAATDFDAARRARLVAGTPPDRRTAFLSGH